MSKILMLIVLLDIIYLEIIIKNSSVEIRDSISKLIESVGDSNDGEHT